jgi:uncharacterized membrane protein YfcA
MDLAELLPVLAAGLVAGLASGLLGVGGGVLFVPALVLFLGLDLLRAEATSLVAVTVVAVVGAWRQRRHGNLRLGDGLAIGVLSPIGVVIGVLLANVAPERVLELGFGGVQLYFAGTLIRQVLRRGDDAEPASGRER